MKHGSPFSEVAHTAAREAAKLHLRYFRSRLEIKTKSTQFDLVTTADIESEKLIVSIIRDTFPDHNIIGEENKYEKTASDYTWIIDPLDGTSNFAHGLPIFSVSIACVKNNSVILGIVGDSTRNEFFFAEKGKGAFLDDEKIAVAKHRTLEQSILITGFYYDRGEKMMRTIDNIKEFLRMGVIGIRRFGSAALDLCNVASGRADGYWECMLNPWDFAAGKLIVEEAGGRVTDEKGKDAGITPSYIVASNGSIHDRILSVLG